VSFHRHFLQDFMVLFAHLFGVGWSLTSLVAAHGSSRAHQLVE